MSTRTALSGKELFDKYASTKISSKVYEVLGTSIIVDTFVSNVTVEAVVKNYEEGRWFVERYLKREFSWDVYRMSKFIETIFLYKPNPPIPPIMLLRVEEKKGRLTTEKFIVIDGYHRLETLRRFFRNEFRLKNVIPDLEGKRFSDLDEDLKRSFLDTSLHVISIGLRGDPSIVRSSLYYVVFDVFKRINVGAKPLTFTQIMFCAYPTEAVRQIRDLAESNLVFSVLGEPTARDRKNMSYCRLLFSLACSIYYGMPIYMASYMAKTKVIDKILGFMFLEDSSEIEDSVGKVRDLFIVASEIRLCRDYFCYMYRREPVRKPVVKTSEINCLLAFIDLYTLYKLVNDLGRDIIVSRADKIRETLLDFAENDLANDRYLREIYHIAITYGRPTAISELCKILYSKLYDKIR